MLCKTKNSLISIQICKCMPIFTFIANVSFSHLVIAIIHRIIINTFSYPPPTAISRIIFPGLLWSAPVSTTSLILFTFLLTRNTVWVVFNVCSVIFTFLIIPIWAPLLPTYVFARFWKEWLLSQPTTYLIGNYNFMTK